MYVYLRISMYIRKYAHIHMYICSGTYIRCSVDAYVYLHAYLQHIHTYLYLFTNDLVSTYPHKWSRIFMHVHIKHGVDFK